jgi:hypothetical protein
MDETETILKPETKTERWLITMPCTYSVVFSAHDYVVTPLVMRANNSVSISRASH